MQAENLDHAVRLENVSRRFGVTPAVNGVSLDIRRGEVLSLVGHSGCGKSTLLRIISGVETIDAGRVLLGNREVDGTAFVEPEERGVGFVFQDYALFPHLSVRDNILFGLKKRSRQEAAASLAHVVDLVGIADLIDRFPHTLSGGEQQRVALARALAPRPEIVLLDEPFSNLDQGLRGKVRSETLKLLKQTGATVIMVTHDPQEALSTGDRVVLMRKGEVVQAGSPYDLHDRPVSEYAAEFFGPTNRVPAVIHADRLETCFGSFPRPAGLNALGDAILHLRPQAIKQAAEGQGISAHIEERTFHGGEEHLVLSVAGLSSPLAMTTFDRLPDGARTVTILFDWQRAFAFRSQS